jgi:hypothetical protein
MVIRLFLSTKLNAVGKKADEVRFQNLSALAQHRVTELSHQR